MNNDAAQSDDDLLIIGDDPWSMEYWDFQKDLLVAAKGLVSGELDAYCEYWKNRTKEDDDQRALSTATAYSQLAQKIRDEGFEADKWRTSDRVFDESRGQGPISVNISGDGKLVPWDGSHRACILRTLGREVHARPWKRAKRWQELREFYLKDKYTTYPHPDFADVKAYRRDRTRMDKVGEAATGLGAKSIAVVGACTGFEVEVLSHHLQPVIGLEPHPERFALLKGWAARLGSGDVFKVYAHEWDGYANVGAVVGMSIYQHAASSLEQWRNVASMISASPVQILELPSNNEHQWHAGFKDEAGGEPKELLVKELAEAGNYTTQRVIYTDETYAKRETILLARSG